VFVSVENEQAVEDQGMVVAVAPAGELAPSEDADARLIALWLHGRSPHTQRAYRTDALRFLVWVGLPLAAVTLGDVQAFADHVRLAPIWSQDESDTDPDTLAPASQARILSSVKSLLAFGHRIGILPVDVGAPLRLPHLKNRLAERILAEPDVQRMLVLEPNERNRTLLRLLYAGGLRVSEICGLTWRDVAPRGEAGQITVLGKGGKTRAVLLSAPTWREIERLRKGAPIDAPVFASRKRGADGSRHLDPSQVFRIIRAAARRAGIDLDVSPHWMRHAHASHALDRGAPIHLVQQTLGHASVATTGRYLHARPTESSSRYLGV
jgi:integrase/recombinase XerD